MGLRVPQNQIVESKYTAGKEYMFDSTYREYIGYYYELNGKLFAGKEFEVNAPELIKINSSGVNNLLTNPFTYIYGKISGTKINTSTFNSIPFNDSDVFKGGELTLSFYCKKINTNIIKRINEQIYNNLQSDPLYQTTYIGIYKEKTQSVEDAEKQMPGIKAFLDL